LSGGFDQFLDPQFDRAIFENGSLGTLNFDVRREGLAKDYTMPYSVTCFKDGLRSYERQIFGRTTVSVVVSKLSYQF
jgi:hypothetical protein